MHVPNYLSYDTIIIVLVPFTLSKHKIVSKVHIFYKKALKMTWHENAQLNLVKIFTNVSQYQHMNAE